MSAGNRRRRNQNATVTPTATSGKAERQAIAIPLLAQGWTRSAVARRLNVDRCTVVRWLSEPEFAERLTTYVDEINEASKRMLEGASKKAVRRLVRNLNHEDGRVSNQAALAILDRHKAFGSPKTKVEHSGEVKGLQDMSDAKLLELARQAVDELERKGGEGNGADG